MPRGMQENRRNNGGNFYCPNGHPQIYAKPRVKELEAELEHKENALRASKCETLQERNAKEAAEKKLRRVKNGVCPCCKRTFINLARHMATKHKETNERSEG